MKFLSYFISNPGDYDTNIVPYILWTQLEMTNQNTACFYIDQLPFFQKFSDQSKKNFRESSKFLNDLNWNGIQFKASGSAVTGIFNPVGTVCLSNDIDVVMDRHNPMILDNAVLYHVHGINKVLKLYQEELLSVSRKSLRPVYWKDASGNFSNCNRIHAKVSRAFILIEHSFHTVTATHMFPYTKSGFQQGVAHMIAKKTTSVLCMIQSSYNQIYFIDLIEKNDMDHLILRQDNFPKGYLSLMPETIQTDILQQYRETEEKIQQGASNNPDVLFFQKRTPLKSMSSVYRPKGMVEFHSRMQSLLDDHFMEISHFVKTQTQHISIPAETTPWKIFLTEKNHQSAVLTARIQPDLFGDEGELILDWHDIAPQDIPVAFRYLNYLNAIHENPAALICCPGLIDETN